MRTDKSFYFIGESISTIDNKYVQVPIHDNSIRRNKPIRFVKQLGTQE